MASNPRNHVTGIAELGKKKAPAEKKVNYTSINTRMRAKRLALISYSLNGIFYFLFLVATIGVCRFFLEC